MKRKCHEIMQFISKTPEQKQLFIFSLARSRTVPKLLAIWKTAK